MSDPVRFDATTAGRVAARLLRLCGLPADAVTECDWRFGVNRPAAVTVTYLLTADQMRAVKAALGDADAVPLPPSE